MFSQNSFLSNFIIGRIASQCMWCGLLVCCLVRGFFSTSHLGKVLYHEFAQLFFETVNC